jgi:REP element-mobilizing transposase RayT
MHCVFATRQRELCLTAPIRVRLWPYLGGIARENGMKALIVGGVADHVHLLLSIPPTLPVAKAMQLLKGNSSKWPHEKPSRNCCHLHGRKVMGHSASESRPRMKR